MAITKMSLVTLNGNVKYINDTMLRCCKAGMFHPERARVLDEYMKSDKIFMDYSKNTGYLRKIANLAAKLGLGISEKDFPDLEKFKEEDIIETDILKDDDGLLKEAYSNPYKELLQECLEISSRINIKLRLVNYKDINLSLEEMQDYLKDIKCKIYALNEAKIEQEKIISEYTTSINYLDNILHTNVDFDELFSCQHLKIRFGRLPNQSYEKIKMFNEEDFIFFPFKSDLSYIWCLYITTGVASQKVDKVFSSIFFERIRIPKYAHGTPQTTGYFIRDQITYHKQQLSKINKEINNIEKKITTVFNKIYSQVSFLNSCFENKKYAAVIGREFYIIGFIPCEYEKKFISNFNELEDVDITIKNPLSDARLEAPVKLKNNAFSKPFELFVSMYGLPSYKDIDPTLFLSIAYTILFGIMFGDIGHGLIIALIGNILWKVKKMDFGKILTRIGFSATFFGVIYGSLFGYEGLFDKYVAMLPPPYERIIHEIGHKSPKTILLVAIIIGIVFLVCSMIFNICVGIKHKDFSSYLLGQNGFAGVTFYLAVITAAASTAFLNINVLSPWFFVFFIIIPLIAMFLKEPLGEKIKGKKFHLHKGFVLESSFELYDILLNFLMNTVSFIRVGAFILSHWGMMLVVNKCVEIIPLKGVGIAVAIFGNIFVICFEGLIVGIQVLRLQFYEIFSRCFNGSGKPFQKI